jgi:hypothetical protein
MIDDLKEILHTMQCSLVVRHGEEVKTYNKKGVRDLWALLWSAPAFLRHSALADKVIGKAAAGIIAEAGVSEVYADVMSGLPCRCSIWQASVTLSARWWSASSSPKATNVATWSASWPMPQQAERWWKNWVSTFMKYKN